MSPESLTMEKLTAPAPPLAFEPKTSSPAVVTDLVLALVHTYTVMQKAQMYHWNVEGSAFFQLHDAFETQYRDAFEALDEIAERIRALGSQVPADVADRAGVASGGIDANVMVDDLATCHEGLADHLRAAIAVAQQAGDEVTADLFIGRRQVHQKFLWMLRSFRR